MLLAQLTDEHPMDYIYEIQVKDLEKSLGKDLNYTYLKSVTKKLINRVYSIHTPIKDEILHMNHAAPRHETTY